MHPGFLHSTRERNALQRGDRFPHPSSNPPFKVTTTSDYNVSLRYASASTGKTNIFLDSYSCNAKKGKTALLGSPVMPNSGGVAGPFSRTTPFTVRCSLPLLCCLGDGFPYEVPDPSTNFFDDANNHRIHVCLEVLCTYNIRACVYLVPEPSPSLPFSASFPQTCSHLCGHPYLQLTPGFFSIFFFQPTRPDYKRDDTTFEFVS